MPATSLPDVTLSPGEFLYLVASEFDLDGVDVLGLDLNRDGGRVSLVAWPDERCQLVVYPDQHEGSSWVPAPWSGPDSDGTDWCAAVPTEGEDNEPCLCGSEAPC
jgi:hypothetical protein